ncbi:protein FAR1-RELATED SEQUENCE 5-like [Silene latifolia]|uniref:protein FAR1-RELATED SEQUENCE 5-like n=1 Tax=Silene latifolia TaxID=37657 RepID=UPI003D774AD3
MIFAPFTGVDHHKKSVTFGASLMSRENDQNFKWIFTKFLDCMGGKEPHCFFTDQCPAMKIAVPATFTTAAHRYYMWHIMKKLPEKVGTTVTKETDFVTRLNSVVWDSDLEPADFEERWCSLISEFQLEDNAWLQYLFSKRQRWIPAYYRDIPLDCLLRTTQCSESENNFFKRFENPHGTFFEFWMRFQSAMDQQRYTQRSLDRDSDHSLPQTKTLLSLEISTVWSEFYSTLTLLKSLPENHINELSSLLKTFRQNFKSGAEKLTKHQELEMLLGVKSSSEVRILPPVQSKNKGTGKRLMSKKDQSVAKAQKPKRFCNNCKQMAHHDRQNCPNPAIDTSQHSFDHESDIFSLVDSD